jgi:hypothetical protein
VIDRRRTRWRLAGGLLSGLALLLSARMTLGEGARDSGAADSEALSVVLATWRAEAFGRVATGAVGWVAAGDGTVRLDLAVDAQPDPVPGSNPDPWPGLLAREGRGWTLVAPPAAEGLCGAWDREWSAPPPGLAALARGVTHWAEGTRADGTSGVGARASGGGESFVLAAAVSEAGTMDADPLPTGLRRELAGRARGGGGPGERVHVGPLAGGAVEVRSSRRPGRLVVTPREERPTSATPEEVFLPWWSLGEILDLPPPAESGTSGGQAR